MASALLVLVVEDDGKLAASLLRMLTALGHSVVATVATGDDAVRAMSLYQPNIILMDIGLEGSMDGVVTASVIRQAYDIPIVFITGGAHEDAMGRAKRAGPYGIVRKPFTQESIGRAVDVAMCAHSSSNSERPQREYEAMLVARRSFLVTALDDMRVELDQINSALGGTPK